ncbi:MAG: hypothetical protein M0D54_12220 [Hyphomonadaceae bacterium JAD_PAG50586_4]|nr:MAG: hypothetical protein M0D54_12220 [Hyphomonadaceae bacterium JAD_PAG50586_4]
MLQRHLQDTYEYLFDTAHNALKAGASFAPFGAGIRKTGEQIHTNVDLPIEKSAPADHISGLIAGFRKDEQENGLIAAGLVFDGRARSDDAAALCFHIEAANGSAVEVIVPYLRRTQSEIAFDEPQITAVIAEIFTEVM